MAELITRATLQDVLEELRLAFRIRIAEKDLEGTVNAWISALTGLTLESVRTAAKRHIQVGEHFPRVKEIRELALDFMARTNGVIARRTEANPRGCAVCGAEYQKHMITRKRVEIVKYPENRTEYRTILEPLFGKDGKQVVVDGKPVMVPAYETVESPREDIFHDPVAHGLVNLIPA